MIGIPSSVTFTELQSLVKTKKIKGGKDLEILAPVGSKYSNWLLSGTLQKAPKGLFTRGIQFVSPK